MRNLNETNSNYVQFPHLMLGKRFKLISAHQANLHYGYVVSVVSIIIELDDNKMPEYKVRFEWPDGEYGRTALRFFVRDFAEVESDA